MQLDALSEEEIKNIVEDLISKNNLLEPEVILAIRAASTEKKREIIPELEDLLKFEEEKKVEYILENPGFIGEVKHELIAKQRKQIKKKEAKESEKDMKLLSSLEDDLKGDLEGDLEPKEKIKNKWKGKFMLIIIPLLIIVAYLIWQKSAGVLV